jgi:hypothetical protein
MKTGTKPVEFNIYPRSDKRGLYYRVRIFKTKKSMHEYCNTHCHPHVIYNVTAMCHARSYRKRINGKLRATLRMGDIHFWGSPDPGVVVHECIHAAIFWLRRLFGEIRIKFGDGKQVDVIRMVGKRDLEEDVCYAAEGLFHNCSEQLLKTGIWK